MNAVEACRLTKTYRTTRALDEATFTVPQGQVVGFLGPNGAGKTTTLRILLGLARATSGSIRVFGEDAARAGNTVRTRIGYLPDVPGFPEWMTAEQLLRFAGSLFGLSGAVLSARVDSLLALAGLTGVSHPIGGFSRGMKQRLGIAQALVNAPSLLVLDEPTSALDPLGRKDVLSMVEALRGKATVVFSTHLLDDVERVCDSVVVVDRGRVLTSDTVAGLRSRYGGSQQVRVSVDDPAALLDAVAGEAWLVAAERDGAAVVLTVTDVAVANRTVPALLERSGCALVSYGPEQVRLEDAFVRLTQEDR
ncbi:MAG: ABC transporter ATP-binding protein [Actinomycetia bacterium]|nr:ABC transporter ATP-binding protein [Actinomycetes bacterium]